MTASDILVWVYIASLLFVSYRTYAKTRGIVSLIASITAAALLVLFALGIFPARYDSIMQALMMVSLFFFANWDDHRRADAASSVR